jgi:hypothetical protein
MNKQVEIDMNEQVAIEISPVSLPAIPGLYYSLLIMVDEYTGIPSTYFQPFLPDKWKLIKQLEGEHELINFNNLQIHSACYLARPKYSKKEPRVILVVEIEELPAITTTYDPNKINNKNI